MCVRFVGFCLLVLGCFAVLPAIASDSKKTVRIATSFLLAKPGHPYQGGTLPAVLLQQAVFDPLVRLDESGEPVPSLALSWSSPDNRIWTFRLRPQIQFANGEPFTAEALVQSHQYMSSVAGRSETVGSYLINIEKVKAIDEHTVEVHLREVDVIFPIRASVWFVPAPVAWKEMGADDFSFDPVGTGPFVMSRYRTARFELKRNPRALRQPKVDAIELIVVKEESSREAALLTEQVDIAMGLSAESKSVVEASGMKFQVRRAPMLPYIAVNLNRDTSSPLENRLVRQAINLAVDRDTMIEVLLQGATKPTGQLAASTSFGFNPAIKPYPFDPQRAKQMLTEAGYPNGFEATLEASLLGSNDSIIYQLIANDLRRVGINITIRAVHITEFTTDLLTGTMPTEMFASGVRSLDPLMDYRFRTCLQDLPGRKPHACYPEVIAAAREARSQTTREGAEALYRRVLQLEYDNPPGIFLWEGVEFDGVNQNLTNYNPIQDFVNFDEISLQQD